MGKHITWFGYIAWAIGLIVYIRVLREWSYIVMAPFLQATWSVDVTLDLFLKHTPISQHRSPSVAPSCSHTVPSLNLLLMFDPCVVLGSFILGYTSTTSFLKHRKEGVEYIRTQQALTLGGREVNGGYKWRWLVVRLNV